MRNVYRILAGLVAVGVVVQAMSIVYGVAGLEKWVEDGGVFDKAASETEDLSFTGAAGFLVHGINGMMIVPAVALLLLVCAFFAKVPGGVRWAGLVLLLVVVQVTLGLLGHEVPAVGALHGLNALLLFGSAGYASWRARPQRVTVADASAAVVSRA
jgi:heme A synthase